MNQLTDLSKLLCYDNLPSNWSSVYQADDDNAPIIIADKHSAKIIHANNYRFCVPMYQEDKINTEFFNEIILQMFLLASKHVSVVKTRNEASSLLMKRDLDLKTYIKLPNIPSELALSSPEFIGSIVVRKNENNEISEWGAFIHNLLGIVLIQDIP
jgi:hypothetical protein